MKLSTELRNQMLAQYESFLGPSPVIEIRTGTAPATCEDTATGTNLVSITLPTDWFTTPITGTVSKQGTWSATSQAQGTAGHYRFRSNSGIVHEQGTITTAGGGGDLEIDSINIALSQIVQIVTWTRTQGGQ
jgi:hypothetical protein